MLKLFNLIRTIIGPRVYTKQFFKERLRLSGMTLDPHLSFLFTFSNKLHGAMTFHINIPYIVGVAISYDTKLPNWLSWLHGSSERRATGFFINSEFIEASLYHGTVEEHTSELLLLRTVTTGYQYRGNWFDIFHGRLLGSEVIAESSINDAEYFALPMNHLELKHATLTIGKFACTEKHPLAVKVGFCPAVRVQKYQRFGPVRTKGWVVNIVGKILTSPIFISRAEIEYDDTTPGRYGVIRYIQNSIKEEPLVRVNAAPWLVKFYNLPAGLDPEVLGASMTTLLDNGGHKLGNSYKVPSDPLITNWKSSFSEVVTPSLPWAIGIELFSYGGEIMLNRAWSFVNMVPGDIVDGEVSINGTLSKGRHVDALANDIINDYLNGNRNDIVTIKKPN